MSTSANPFHLPLSISQVFELVKQLPAEHKKKLIKALQKEDKENGEIPEEHKAIVRKRIKNSKASELLDWDKSNKQITFNSIPKVATILLNTLRVLINQYLRALAVSPKR